MYRYIYATVTNKCNIITATRVNENKQTPTATGPASVSYCNQYKTPLQKPNKTDIISHSTQKINS